MAGDDPRLLVVPGGVAGELEDLGGEILHDGGQVDRGSGSNSLGVVSLAEQPEWNDMKYWLQSLEWREISPVDTAHRELETSAAGPGLGLHLGLATFATAGHCEDKSGFISETQKLGRKSRVCKMAMFC